MADNGASLVVWEDRLSARVLGLNLNHVGYFVLYDRQIVMLDMKIFISLTQLYENKVIFKKVVHHNKITLIHFAHKLRTYKFVRR